MNDIYRNPQSELLNNSALELNYASLGIWRKIYLALNWIGSILLFSAMLIGAFKSPENIAFGIVVAIVVGGLALGFVYWMHRSIVRRDVSRLLIIALLNLIPLMNPLACLIMFAIRSTSKRELETANAATNKP